MSEYRSYFNLMLVFLPLDSYFKFQGPIDKKQTPGGGNVATFNLYMGYRHWRH